MTTVATDLGNTRESARRIRVSPTGGVTATNVQKALESIGGATPSGAGNTQTITSNNYGILSTDTIIYVNFGGTVTLTLPDAAAWLAGTGGKGGFPLLLKDISGAGGLNNITITRAGANTIDGETSLTISANFGGYKLQVASANWVIVG